jgi:Uma2 family endonuclease
VVELASPSDEGPRGLTALRQKMAAYQRNGARLGWLIIPEGCWMVGFDPQQGA